LTMVPTQSLLRFLLLKETKIRTNNPQVLLSDFL
jgi:hypothetical protein